jgi:hypothetical protein
MEISVSLQAKAVLLSACAGAARGLLYDMMRAGRYKARGRAVTGVLDALFWLCAMFTVFWSVTALGEGELRLFTLFGIALGGLLYFLTLSRFLLFICVKAAALAARAMGYAAKPYIILCVILKKSVNKQKKIFQTRLKCCKLRSLVCKAFGRIAGRVFQRERISGEKEKGKPPGENRGHRFCALRRGYPAFTPDPDKGSEGKQRGSGGPAFSAGGDKRQAGGGFKL